MKFKVQVYGRKTEAEANSIDDLLLRWKKGGLSMGLYTSMEKMIRDNPAHKMWQGKEAGEIWEISKFPMEF